MTGGQRRVYDLRHFRAGAKVAQNRRSVCSWGKGRCRSIIVARCSNNKSSNCNSKRFKSTTSCTIATIFLVEITILRIKHSCFVRQIIVAYHFISQGYPHLPREQRRPLARGGREPGPAHRLAIPAPAAGSHRGRRRRGRRRFLVFRPLQAGEVAVVPGQRGGGQPAGGGHVLLESEAS